MNWNWRMGLSAVLLLIWASIVGAQSSEDVLKETVKNDECVKALSKDTDLLRVRRRQELEDILTSLQLNTSTQARDFKNEFIIFEVSNTGIFIRGPKGPTRVDSSGGKLALLVAINERSGRVYPLFGCSGAEDGFGGLIKHARISVNSEFDAEQFGLLRYTLVEDPQNARLILNDRSLRHKVEDFLFSRFSALEAEKKFERWSRGYKSTKSDLDLGIRASATGTGFTSSITYLLGSSTGVANLHEVTINLTREGEYSIVKNEVLLRTSGQ